MKPRCRFVPSRFSDHPSTYAVPSMPPPSGENLIDSLDFELDLFGTTNTRYQMPYSTNTQFLQELKPPTTVTQLNNPTTQPSQTNIPR